MYPLQYSSDMDVVDHIIVYRYISRYFQTFGALGSSLAKHLWNPTSLSFSVGKLCRTMVLAFSSYNFGWPQSSTGRMCRIGNMTGTIEEGKQV